MTCENNCRLDRILSLRCVARIQTGLNSCDISLRPNKRKPLSQHQCRRGDLSPRRVAAICRIVCLGLSIIRTEFSSLGSSVRHADHKSKIRNLQYGSRRRHEVTVSKTLLYLYCLSDGFGNDFCSSGAERLQIIHAPRKQNE